MKLQSQRFTLEDFKDQESWIGKLFSPLNKTISDIVIAFANNLSVSDNLYQEIKEITFKDSASEYPLKFRTKFNVFPRGLMSIYLYNKTLDTYSTETPLVVWTFQDNEIKISDISGLTANSQYTIRLLIIYG